MDYKISKEELFRWVSMPTDEFIESPDLKLNLVVKKDRPSGMLMVGNMMADEVIANNKANKPTKWVLPAGPTDEFDIFIDRVNKERISLKNLWVFHMDEFLDWEGRPYPVADTYESLEGTMNACFYGRIDEELNVPEDQRIWPRYNDVDYPDLMCEKLGGIDTVWAGMGAKGLIAFCEAPRRYSNRISIEEYANSKTKIVDINEDTIVALSERTFGACYDRIPPKSVTLGFKVMASAKRLVLMVMTGSWKQTAVRVACFSEPTLEYPATILVDRIPEVVMVCDENTVDHPMSHTIRGW